MKYLIKFLLIILFLFISTSLVFSNEIKIENFNEYPVTVYLYYSGDFLMEQVIPPKTTWKFDIGDRKCSLYSMSHSHYKERPNARVQLGKFKEEEDCYKLI